MFYNYARVRNNCEVDMILKKIEIPPSKSLMNVLANSGYTIPTAIADIIDNSIAHHADKVEVWFHRNGPESYVEIADNGDGMNENELIQAMKLGEKDIRDERDSDDLGRFSVGMKTASASFCKTLKVISKGSEGITNAYVFPFGSDGWFIEQVETSEDDIKSKTGTKVIWQYLRFSGDDRENERILNGQNEEFVNICEKVRSHLAKVFGLIIKSGNLSIRLNDLAIVGWSPFEIPDGNVSKFYEDNSFEIGGQSITVKSFLIPNMSKMNKQQFAYARNHEELRLADFEGFYIYRNNRLIVSGGWLGLEGLGVSEKYNYARIGVWFDASVETDKYFKINFLKDSVNIPDTLSAYLTKVAKTARKKSATSYDSSKMQRPYKRRDKSKDVQVWDTGHSKGHVVFSINRDHPLVKKYTEGLDVRKKEALFKLVEMQFPFAELQNQLPKASKFTDEQLKSMLKEEFDRKMKDEGLTFGEARDAILSISPFSDDVYIGRSKELIFELLESGEVESNAIDG